MSKIIVLLFSLLLGSWAPLLFGHTASTSALYLDVGRESIGVSIHLPVDQLVIAAPELFVNQAHSDHRVDSERLFSYLNQHIRIKTATEAKLRMALDDVALEEQSSVQYVVATLTFSAASEEIAGFHLESDAILHRVVSHRTYVSLRSDIYNGMLAGQVKPIDVLRYKHKEVLIDRQSGSGWTAFKAMFGNGAHHIADGTDHLMFLLCLLLPAPLLAANGRWRRLAGMSDSLFSVLKIVTAFTLGHSLTLSLVVFGLIKAPVQQVEILVAFSVIVSAVHALRPFFQHYAVLIAVGFGLIHGMAFAAEMLGLGFSLDAATLATLGFNLGVETVQLLIVCAVMPCLYIMARTPLYPAFRWLCAGLAIIAACGWLSERVLGWNNLIEPWLEWALQSPAQLYLALLLLCGCSVFRPSAILMRFRSKS